MKEDGETKKQRKTERFMCISGRVEFFLGNKETKQTEEKERIEQTNERRKEWEETKKWKVRKNDNEGMKGKKERNEEKERMKTKKWRERKNKGMKRKKETKEWGGCFLLFGRMSPKRVSWLDLVSPFLCQPNFSHISSFNNFRIKMLF